MALTKVSTASTRNKVVPLIASSGSKDVAMAIDPKAMAFIIERLTDLYPNPVVATVRETISNATDAVMLLPEGERQPVVISSPTVLSPIFTVKDFGVGMSPEDVEKIYALYGGSTKREDFSQIGAFGLGAKAPLAYTSQFQLTTTQGGVTTDVTIKREAHGNTVEILSVEETGLPSGTTISIPVQEEDHVAFRKALEIYTIMAADVPLKIDGRAPTGENYYLLDSIILDEDTGLEGRVWVAKDYFNSWGRELLRYGRVDFHVAYMLSGWVYNLQRHYNRDIVSPNFIVELKPGVVDFSSSRDEITSNKRFTRLQERVLEAYSTRTARTLDLMLKVYRGLDKHAATTFFSGVARYLDAKEDHLRVNPRTNYRNSYQEPDAVLALTSFRTDEGFDPVALMLEPSRNVFFGLVDYVDSYGKSSYSFKELHVEGLNPSFVARGGRVGDVNNLLLKAQENPASMAFRQTVLALPSALASGKKFTVVEAVDEESLLYLTRHRKAAATHLFERGHALMSTLTLTKKEREFIKSALPQVTFASAAELVTSLRDHLSTLRAAARKAAQEEGAPLITLEVVAEKLEDVAAVVPNAYRTSVTVTLEDLLQENPVILVSESAMTFKEVFFGVANSMDLSGRAVYHLPLKTNVGRGPQAKEWNILEGHEDLYVHPLAQYNCEAYRRIHATKARKAKALTSRLEKVSREEALALYLLDKDLYMAKDFYAALAPTVATDEVLQGIFFLLAKAPAVSSRHELAEMGAALLDLHFTEEEILAVQGLIAGLRRLNGRHWEKDFEGRILLTYMESGYAAPETPLTITVREAFLKRLQEHMEEFKTSVAKAAAEVA